MDATKVNPTLIMINKYFNFLNILYMDIEKWLDELGIKAEYYSDEIKIKEDDDEYEVYDLLIDMGGDKEINITPTGVFNDSVYDGRAVMTFSWKPDKVYFFYSKGDIVSDKFRMDPEEGQIKVREFTEGWMYSKGSDAKDIKVLDKGVLNTLIK